MKANSRMSENDDRVVFKSETVFLTKLLSNLSTIIGFIAIVQPHKSRGLKKCYLDTFSFFIYLT